MERIGLLFPGQGSQFVGMGKDLYQQYPEVTQLFAQADEFLGFSLSSIMFEGPEETLLKTTNSQLAIYLHSLAVLEILSARCSFNPVLVSGLSLGEYTALTASKRISLEDGLRVVQKRAELMNAACEQSLGAMAAVLGLTADIVLPALESLGSGIWVANYNAPKQIVIAGVRDKVEEAAVVLRELGAKKVVMLKVSGAFHTPLMQSAQDELAPYLYQLAIRDSSIAFASNVVGELVQESEMIRSLMVKQMTSPTLWYQTCFQIDSKVDLFLELGSGNVLTGLCRSIGLASPCKHLGSVEDIENFCRSFE
ncbi:[acyl-carrier-protein] S-malonyltransferase [Chlamydia muridarum str. Nigg]|jgi:malonyl CoA-acyl carrier protein transacylase|uniref:Malonyl CoA-acyl carrier protein transacylase n=2 Tax=Chlamydia muridarum TaxID=83560 RepID=A0A069ZZ02_CHLMR|nr:ACP S-malonyltransferase [Chlamydia muridarum]UFW99765.1 ACP S-malonyltransferase [Chlamydia trachomatis]AAF39351.1 malonyl CoA-acyl carrier protein transacylase [Chlamydia muridarum str. Nigg]AHH22898.1 ACP S-malonyltransferase [Chlamydia muridarum str. Nigg3 CMUT3-5]AHH23823.1 ACP S-malonyltransferase [Chlamydia muridarum str. Nigg CM972]AID38032.1 ACP S-malonyltransferase [Chlamydia muridarum str. Nigg 2 MCR]